jgi:hypothetical protein
MENLKARRTWSEVLWILSEKHFNLRILYLTKQSFKMD